MPAKRRLVLILLLLPLLLAACDSFERNTYRALKLAKVEYQILEEHAARAYVHGRLTPEQWDRFALAGHRFIAAHTLAADLAETYRRVKQSGDPDRLREIQQRIEQALTRLPVLLADLQQLLESFDTGAAPAARSTGDDR